MKVASEPVTWARNGKPRIAGVSSFGFSGTNAHVVLEESPAEPAAVAQVSRVAELLVLSAKTGESVESSARRLATHVESHPEQSVGDVAYSLATTRTAMAERLSVVA